MNKDEKYVKHIYNNLLCMVKYCNDWKFVQNECLNNIDKNDYLDLEIIRLSIICLGHIARIHKCIDREYVFPLLNEKIKDKELFGFIDDALGDIEQFTGKLTSEEIEKYPNLYKRKLNIDKI